MADPQRLMPLIEDFMNGLGAAKRSQNTLDAYRRDLLGVADRIAQRAQLPVEALELDSLDRPAMTSAFASWASDHAEASVLRAWGVWHRLFEQLVDDSLLERNPMRGVPKPKAPQSAPRAIRHDNPAEAILAVAATEDPTAKQSKRWPARDVAIAGTFCVTGIRLEELIGLDLDSVTGPAGARRLQVTGKGKKDRAIPVQPALEAVIDAYLATRAERHGEDALRDPSAPLFVHYDGSRLTRGRVQYLIDKLYRRAGIRSAVPAGALVHALRHSFATIALENGADVAEVRDLLGHTSLATTSRYLDATANRLRQAVAAHPAQRALPHIPGT